MGSTIAERDSRPALAELFLGAAACSLVGCFRAEPRRGTHSRPPPAGRLRGAHHSTGNGGSRAAPRERDGRHGAAADRPAQPIGPGAHHFYDGGPARSLPAPTARCRTTRAGTAQVAAPPKPGTYEYLVQPADAKGPRAEPDRWMVTTTAPGVWDITVTIADQWAVTAGLRLRDEAIEIASWTLRHGDRSTTVRPVLPVPDLVLPASAGTTWDKTSYDLQAGAAIRSTGRYLERQAVPLCGTLVDAPTEARPTMRGAAAAVALVLLAAACGRHDRPPPIAVHVADFTAPDGIIMAEERGIDERLARAGDDALIGAARLWRLERGGRIVGTPAGGHVGAGGRSGRRRGAGNTAGCGAHRSSRGAISWRYDREAQRRAQCFRRRAAGSHPGELVHPCRVRPAQPARGPRPSPDSQFRGAATRRAGR